MSIKEENEITIKVACSNDELIKLSNVIMNFILYTSSYRINYIYQQLLPTIYK